VSVGFMADEWLSAFHAVAEERRFTRAAKRLNVSTSRGGGVGRSTERSTADEPSTATSATLIFVATGRRTSTF
jgi:regulatory helix-turn-helix LysR family protein